MQKPIRSFICFFCLLLCQIVSSLMAAENLPAEDSAVIIMYHRFGEGKYPSTNITVAQFEAHLAELKREKYTILPLADIVRALQNGEKLPARTVALSIDDAYLSIMTTAWPRLKAAKIPFTLFVSTEPVSAETPGYMTWDHIRTLAADPLVTIGHHGHSHGHFLDMSPAAVAADLKKANALYQQELGYVPDIFAWPFGEFSLALIPTVKAAGLKAALAQFSSVAHSSDNPYALPRFAFSERYAALDRFRLIVNARALPVHDVLPLGPVLDHNPPAIGFTLETKIPGRAALRCYASHLDKPTRIIPIDDTRIEVRFDQPFPTGRNRLNCTMPGPDNRWYWFGQPFFVP